MLIALVLFVLMHLWLSFAAFTYLLTRFFNHSVTLRKWPLELGLFVVTLIWWPVYLAQEIRGAE